MSITPGGCRVEYKQAREELKTSLHESTITSPSTPPNLNNSCSKNNLEPMAQKIATQKASLDC